MDHGEAIRAMAAEKYLLEELAPEAREQFEEHFFGCQDCATDVRAGLAFLEHTRVELAETPSVAVAKAPGKQTARWLAWLRPQFAAPALALLLAIVGYQQFVTVAKLKSPKVLAATYLTMNSRGGETKVISTRTGEPFNLEVPGFADPRFTSYVAELQSPTNQVQWSHSIENRNVQGDAVVVTVPGVTAPGVYTLRMSGVTSDGQRAELGSTRFEVKLQ